MKRGQITIFIILGLLIVLAVGSLIYLNTGQLQNTAVPQVQEVAEDAQPVQNFITQCLAIVATEGLRQIGDHGGYLSVRDIPDTKFNPSNPTESDVLFFAPDSDYGLPYWWYMKSENNCRGSCEFASKKPALYANQGRYSIEESLQTYVEKNLDSCLKDFKPLTEQKIIIEMDDDREVRVYITDDNVAVSVEQTFMAQTEAGRNTLDSFVTTLPVHLKDIYELAQNITTLEQENAFLAKHTRQLISAFSRTDEASIPPVGSVELSLGPGTIWVKSIVEQRLIQILQNYMPLLQVFGTGNYRPIAAPEFFVNDAAIDNALNRNAVIPNLKNTPHLAARFAYLSSWKPYFDLNCKGQICKPTSIINTFVFAIGVQDYNFAYDVSVPVILEIDEPGAFNGQGYTFRLALEGNMRNNEPITTDWKQPEVGETSFARTLLCNENSRTSGIMNITLRDTVTNELVDGSIAFNCGSESCAIGTTTDGQLQTRLPPCIGGVLSALRENYLSDAVLFDPDESDQHIEIALNPIIEINVSAQKYQLRKSPATQSWELSTEPVLFTKFDQAFVTLIREPTDSQDQFSSFAGICGSPLYKRQEYSRNVKITAGNYSVSIVTLYHGNITIPAEERCFDDGGSSGMHTPGQTDEDDEETCVTIPAEPIFFGNATKNACVSEKPFPSGMMQFNWEVTPQMLNHMKNVRFTAITVGAELPETRLVIEDLSQIDAVQSYTESELMLVKPEILQ